MRKKNGFSLLELLIVIVIIAIIVIIALPVYFRALEDAKRNTQWNNINAFIKQIELFSIKSGRFPTLQEFQNIIKSSQIFSEIPLCPYNGKNYTFTSSLSSFRTLMQNNNFNNAHILYYESTSKSYTIFYYPPKFYIGNKVSKRFHYLWCWTLPEPQNQVLLKTREEAIEKGYIPCGNCKP